MISKPRGGVHAWARNCQIGRFCCVSSVSSDIGALDFGRGGDCSSVGHEFICLWIAPVSALLLVGVALSSLRLKLITADLGYPLSFRDAAMTLSVGQLAGTAFFQLAGQLIGRSAVLSRRGIPPARASSFPAMNA